MSLPNPQNLPVVVLACQVFQHWIENLLPPDLRAEITFLDYGLHAVPKNLRKTIQNTINNLPQPSLVMLGYGLCGNGLDKIEAGPHYLLIPRTDDCIAILLGSYQAYRREMEREPGTYTLTKGWLEAGTNPLEESQRYEQKYGPEKAAWLMDTQYKHYKRLALVARSPQEMAEYRAKAQQVAQYCARWGMRYEEINGSDDYLERLVKIVTQQLPPGEDFLLIEPGGSLTQAQFFRNT